MRTLVRHTGLNTSNDIYFAMEDLRRTFISSTISDYNLRSKESHLSHIIQLKNWNIQIVISFHASTNRSLFYD